MDRQGFAHDARCSFGCGRGPRRHHAGLRLGRHRWARSPSAPSPPSSACGPARASRRCWATTTRSTCSACTASAASSARILTGVFNDPALGGTDVYDYVANAYPDPAAYDMGAHVISQLWGVGVTLLWSGIVSADRVQAGRSHHRPARERGAGARRPRHRVARRARLQRLIRTPRRAGFPRARAGNSAQNRASLGRPFLLRASAPKRGLSVMDIKGSHRPSLQ